ncbi:MAG TPA: M15 family metallopeptidase [Actinomycetota bacterium]
MTGSSWHEGCPVSPDALRLLRLSYWGFDRRAHVGEMIVDRDVAADVVTVFRTLFAARFPIQRMHLVDDYGGDDERSMEANNTSGFNCRFATGHPGLWSEHSYGRAVDVNPLLNPYAAADGSIEPANDRRYADRSRHDPGMIHPGDVVVRAFASIGWAWGGAWTSVKDYQHFSLSGR